MCKRKFLIFMSVVLIVAVLSLGIEPVCAQSAKSNGKGNSPPQQPPGQQWTLEDFQNAAAAARAEQGLQRSTTNDQRWQAAIDSADRRASAERGKGKGGGK